MPSSLAVIHSSALVYSTRPRVSVWGTGACRLELSGFSREHDYARYCLPHGAEGILSRSALAADLPAAIYAYTLQRAIPSARSAATLPSPRRTGRQCRNVDRLCHRPRHTLSLRARLTLIRLALIRKPWSYGGQVSRLPYRYLYLHLRFQQLQHRSRGTFYAVGMLPYRFSQIPGLRQGAYARLLSTPDSSTSELLRTL